MKRTKPKRDEERENRIDMEIVVDCYDEHERAMGWYYYLEGTLQFPFTARCIEVREISPLKLKDEVEVIGMPKERECRSEMFVTIRWDRGGLAVPLAQLEPGTATDDETKQAVEDWHYWVRSGYDF